MAFTSHHIDDYMKIYSDPKKAIQYINSNKLNRHDAKQMDDRPIDDRPIDGRPMDAKQMDDEPEEYDIMGEDMDTPYIEATSNRYDLTIGVENNNIQIYDKDLEFQLLDINYYHTVSENDDKQFNIMLFGKTRDDKSVYVHVDGFTPFFYVEMDHSWRGEIILKIMNHIKNTVSKKNRDGVLSYKLIKKHKFYGFTNEAELSFLQITFKSYDAMRAYAYAFTNKHKMPYINRLRLITFTIYESNINPIIRFLHIQKLDPVGWIRIAKEDMIEFNPNYKNGATDINVCCRWDSVTPIDCRDILKFKIMSFDIECTSEDGKFPCNRPGDQIIQIGFTFSLLGESECYKKIILCLHSTDNIPGAIVLSFDTETDLLLAFTNVIRKEDPDFITGYNIFGFDYKYLKERAEKMGILTRFSRLSRIHGMVCEYVDTQLSSSALGDNSLRYFDTPGRVSIDLMKVIQRDYKLSSYKLDSVASNFIRDKITGIILNLNGVQYNSQSDATGIALNNICDTLDDNDRYTLTLCVRSTYGIYRGDYMAIQYNDGYTDNPIGKKYMTTDIQVDHSITIDGMSRQSLLELKEAFANKWKIVWCQAKDDIDPHDIFRLFKKKSSDRALIAKYCLQDCAICNRLMAKLQILPNSIGMGNVCCVPVSYLFLRGQGVKIFSLVSRQCREENYLIPVIQKKKKKDSSNLQKNEGFIKLNGMGREDRFGQFVYDLIKKNDEDDDEEENHDTYEGATVYDPDKGVHYSPIIVFDYGSLYPSSMIMKNLSHNSIVIDPKYDNLPGYIYHSQQYNQMDGTVVTKRFAEKANGVKATIPRIEMDLLAARKKCKQTMDSETDPFKKSIWDGLQLAYKVTANSLYGQCGAPTSPIFMKDIAACTTAIGRDMLGLGKNYCENILPVIIRLITADQRYEYVTYMKEFYKNVDEKRLVDTKYNGKDEYFEYIRKEIFTIMTPYEVSPRCIYGDTDSVFFKLNLTDKKTGKIMDDHPALVACIKLGPVSSSIINNTLDSPQVLNYEKVYWPFVIISKKRYVGNLYEYDPNNYYQKSMGLVTKRRDNADIVKTVLGGIIDHILNKRDRIGAINFTKNSLEKIITEKYPIEKFIITKTLKDQDKYADWKRIVHAVLADRMGHRDPGNKPQSNDRVPYVYIETPKKCKLQGDMVETPQYVIQNKLRLDYLFYITNQIMKPAMQFLELIAKNPESIFKMYIIREENRKGGTTPIMKYYPNGFNNLVDNVSFNNSIGDDIFGKKLITKHTKTREKRSFLFKKN